MFIYCDWETRSPNDLKLNGVDRYVLDVEPLLFTYAIDEGPVQAWYPEDGPMPDDLREALKDHYLVAFNSRFDRLVSRGVIDAPVEQWLDIAAQAQAWSVRGTFDQVCRALKLKTKPAKGQQAMKLISNASVPIESIEPETWDRFEAYAVHDTTQVRHVMRRTAGLSVLDWADFHVSERINDRGIPIDVDLARACAKYRDEAALENDQALLELTGIPRLTLSKQITAWVFERVPAQAQHLMQPEEEGRLSLDGKKVLPQLAEYVLEHSDDLALLDTLELLTHGRSNVAVKFEKMVATHVDGRLYGSFKFNGAGQTGRYSSQGVQLHNLTRAKLDNELDVIDAVMDSCSLRELQELADAPINKTLGMLLRPTIIAPEGRLLQWGDWSAIEARIAPWLTDGARSAEKVLDVFRRGGDLYEEAAQWMFAEPEGMRQASKVACLALQFGGFAGAYRAMARGYGLRPTHAEAMDIASRWRKANPWAPAFWERLMKAAWSTLGTGRPVKVGRLLLEYRESLGALLLWLPSGRPLYYPRIREWRDDEDGSRHLIFNRGAGVERLWHGKLIENAVQGCAADLLRRTLRSVPDTCVGHTHDEILLELDAPMDLETLMIDAPDWADDLPLAAEVTYGTYYHK